MEREPPRPLLTAPAAMTGGAAARNFLVHLRLPFQLLLAPFMLFGAALANGAPGRRFLLAFLVLHVALYGGTTAFNSHYDKDEGPIGGLESPPPPGPWLLPGSLLLQGLGLALAALVNRSFLVVSVLFAVLGFLYSHPSTRLKARPWASWAVVMFGQGMLGALAGFVTVDGGAPGRDAAWGLAAAAVIVGGLYPLTQVFQVEEDRRRGDRTVAIALGRSAVPYAATALFALGGMLMAVGAVRGGRYVDLALFATSPLLLGAGAFWVCRPADPRRAFRRVAVFQIAASSAFALYATLRMML